MTSKMAAPQSMEQSTLHSMIHERDAQISFLLHQLHSISDNISSLQKELHHKSQARKHQREEHSAAIKKLKEEHAEQRAHLARYESKIKGGGGLRVHEYASLMKAANKDVESSYVIRLQAQLCRAMHSLGVMESQLALVKENCSSLIKCMKEDLSHMVDDRTRREVELMNTLAHVDAEKRAWQAEMEKKLRDQEDLLDSVRDEYEELGLEYDEEEVRRALEVQMLQEQVERVKKEKVLAEKDLLAALLEREEQIGKVKSEMEGLESTLKDLKGDDNEDDKKEVANGDDVASNVANVTSGESNEANSEEKIDMEVSNDDDDQTKEPNASPAVEHENKSAPVEPIAVQDNVSELTSKLEETQIEEPEKLTGDEKSPDDTANESQVDGERGDSYEREDGSISQEEQSNEANDANKQTGTEADLSADSDEQPRVEDVENPNDAVTNEVTDEDKKHDDSTAAAADETPCVEEPEGKADTIQGEGSDEDAYKPATSESQEESESPQITADAPEDVTTKAEEGGDSDPTNAVVSTAMKAEKEDSADPDTTDNTTNEDKPSSNDDIKNGEPKEEK